MRPLLTLFRLLAGLLVMATAVPAVLALAGFAVPILDLFNHLQLLLFFGTLAGLLLALVLRMGNFWRLLAAVGLIASAIIFVPEWVAGTAARTPVGSGTVVKVMTHNVFGLNYDMQRVAEVIEAEDPDIVALQEFFPEQAGLGGLLKAKYPYSVRCQGGKRANLGLFSKLPFDREMTDADCPTAAYGKQRTAHIIAGFALADGSHFTLMTTHMDWPYPVERQHDEFAGAEQAVQSISGPLLVMGDFNSTPWSYAMKGFETATGLRRETRNLMTYPLMITVPHRLSADGFLHTVPFLPLDQVFGRGVDVHDIRTGAPTGSDHLPVVFTFTVAREAA